MLTKEQQSWAQGRYLELVCDGLGMCAAIDQVEREVRERGDGPDSTEVREDVKP